VTGPSLGSDRRLHAGLVVMFFTVLVMPISIRIKLAYNSKNHNKYTFDAFKS
jgi:hypothetical protein